MPGANQPTKPLRVKPVGTEFATLGELKDKEEQKNKSAKLPKYTPKKRVIFLPAPRE